MRDNVQYSDGRLRVLQSGSTHEVEPAHIVHVYECRMADPIHHGEESFHVLCLTSEFWLFGPAVTGALGAVQAMLKENPGMRLTDATVGRVPWTMRQRGTFGLRLWPVAGFGRFPNAELDKLHMREVSDG